ncbi:endonuclease/exonuclease/phosphatase family protein [Tamlana sp. s12]|uniref:endonuclease/exonuclease/phosphatase family protein n=1 Tax=Tamlana sp. s12 TaxID=1630406 RepID=UPI0007FEA151|nr:endonuclease/exonuclease/phosphatase family protein [Tamlana sp. s12]OBQ55932.1 endonuclease [Tamlana sp. s12]QQY83563.1 endonuclease/exonuclease/phosphatase family protein [Tamlana sp. s12]
MKNLSFINKIIYFINVIFAVLLLSSFILPYLPPKTFAVLAVLNLGVSFLIGINFLFVLYWLIKLKRQCFMSMIILLLGYFLYGSLYRFSSTTEVESPGNIKIMNYNVRLFDLYDWIPEDNTSDNIVAFIKKESPDIICIEEFHPRENLDFSFYDYQYKKIAGKKVKHGQAIFSKFPIINSGSLGFPNTSNNAIFADVVKGVDTFRVYNVHLESMHINTQVDSLRKETSEKLLKRVGTSFKMQQSQAELILEHQKQCHYKVVICGDFNNTAFSYVYRTIKGDLNDTFDVAGNGFGRSYDFRFFPIRIDFILTDKAFKINGFKNYDVHYSDHYPIMATLSLEE